VSELSGRANALDAADCRLVVLQPEIGLGEAHALKRELLAALEHPALALDASQVRQIGTAGVQLLVALALELKRQSKSFDISVASESFCAALKVLGVEQLLPQPALVTFD
jgi:anti-anti-sigma regulatory factor